MQLEQKYFGSGNDWQRIGGSLGALGGDPWDQPEPSPIELLGANEDIVFACVNRIADFMSGIKLRLCVTTSPMDRRPLSTTKSLDALEYKRLQNDYRSYTRKAIQIEEIVDHKILDLLEKPNATQTFGKLIGLTQRYLDLVGSAFWWFIRNPYTDLIQEIWLLPSQWVTLKLDGEGVLESYVYQGNGTREEFKPRDVLHFKNDNMYDPFNSFGMSPLRAVWQRVQLLRQEQSSWQAVLNNAAIPSQIITPPDGETWTDAQAERVDKQVTERFRYGFEGGVWVVQDAIAMKPVSNPPKDLVALSMYEQIKEAVCAAYGVPVALISPVESSQIAATLTHQDWQLGCLKPRAINLLSSITHTICREQDPSGRLFLCTDEIVEPDRAFELQKAMALWQANAITQNQLLASQGYPPVENGDRLISEIIGQGSTMGTLPSFQTTR